MHIIILLLTFLLSITQTYSNTASAKIKVSLTIIEPIVISTDTTQISNAINVLLDKSNSINNIDNIQLKNGVYINLRNIGQKPQNSSLTNERETLLLSIAYN